MPRAIAILFAALLSVSLAYAVRGSGVPTVVKQADGTSITIIVMGDEYSRYTTTVDGYQIVQQDGVYYYWQAEQSKSGRGLVKASDPIDRSAFERDALIGRAQGNISASVYGATRSDPHISLAPQTPQSRAVGVQPKYVLVILVQFQDVKFQSSNDVASFNYMLNTAPKSAQRYFSDNSMSAYVPIFDVSEIITLPREMAYYGGNVKGDGTGGDVDGRASDMIRDACRLAVNSIGSFTKYDSNSDGNVDNVYVLFAGHNEAEGGGANTVWPHQSYVSGAPLYGGAHIWSYICGSELSGASGAIRAGIGTLCHEFSHVLGLPDFYDTDYAVNGLSAGLDKLSLMSSGNYNDGGHTPPFLNAYERNLLKWNTLSELQPGQNKSLTPIQEQNNAHFFPSKASADEFYVIEYRNGKVGLWDQPLGESYVGMLIYHIDRSNNDSGGGVKAITRWSNNTVNANSSHPCMYVVPSLGPVGLQNSLFPGSKPQTSFTGKHKEGVDWRGNPIMVELIDIKSNGSTVTFATRSSQGTGEVMSFNIGQREVEVVLATSTTPDRFVLRYKPSKVDNALAWKSIDIAANENRTKIENLVPDTYYDIELFAVNGSVSTKMAQSQFMTMLLDAPFPAIVGVKSSYAVGESLNLGVTNINGSYTDISFTLDGQALIDRKYTLTTKGTFTLVCTINYSGQDREVITRKIFVK